MSESTKDQYLTLEHTINRAYRDITQLTEDIVYELDTNRYTDAMSSTTSIRKEIIRIELARDRIDKLDIDVSSL